MKGIILAAGYGTRFLPITKTIPKEMLPLGTRPAIDYVVQEYIDAGIRDILIINSRRKKTLEDYYDREAELEAVFTAENKSANLQRIAPPEDVRFYFIRQRRMGGTGDAVLLAREFAGSDPCVLSFPDDLHFGEVPLARQLWEVHERTGNAVLALEERPAGEDISRYGVAEVEAGTDPLRVTGLIEKPPTGQEPSRFISIGRFLLTPAVFDALADEHSRHERGEFYLTSALHQLGRSGRASGCVYTGERLDTGEPLGYYQAMVRFILQDPQQGPAFREFLRGALQE